MEGAPHAGWFLTTPLDGRCDACNLSRPHSVTRPVTSLWFSQLRGQETENTGSPGKRRARPAPRASPLALAPRPSDALTGVCGPVCWAFPWPAALAVPITLPRMPTQRPRCCLSAFRLLQQKGAHWAASAVGLDLPRSGGGELTIEAPAGSASGQPLPGSRMPTSPCPRVEERGGELCGGPIPEGPPLIARSSCKGQESSAGILGTDILRAGHWLRSGTDSLGQGHEGISCGAGDAGSGRPAPPQGVGPHPANLRLAVSLCVWCSPQLSGDPA